MTYIPMARDFLSLAAVIDWCTHGMLLWRLSITVDSGFCLETVKEALQRHGNLALFNTEPGGQFKNAAFTDLLKEKAIGARMDGRGCWREKVFVERSWSR